MGPMSQHESSHGEDELTPLFGKLLASKQILLTVALVLSVVRPLLILEVVWPSVARRRAHRRRVHLERSSEVLRGSVRRGGHLEE